MEMEEWKWGYGNMWVWEWELTWENESSNMVSLETLIFMCWLRAFDCKYTCIVLLLFFVCVIVCVVIVIVVCQLTAQRFLKWPTFHLNPLSYASGTPYIPLGPVAGPSGFLGSAHHTVHTHSTHSTCMCRYYSAVVYTVSVFGENVWGFSILNPLLCSTHTLKLSPPLNPTHTH